MPTSVKHQQKNGIQYCHSHPLEMCPRPKSKKKDQKKITVTVLDIFKFKTMPIKIGIAPQPNTLKSMTCWQTATQNIGYNAANERESLYRNYAAICR